MTGTNRVATTVVTASELDAIDAVRIAVSVPGYTPSRSRFMRDVLGAIAGSTPVGLPAAARETIIRNLQS